MEEEKTRSCRTKWLGGSSGRIRHAYDGYMPFDYSRIHHRASTRLQSLDYAATGMYFVTVCTLGKECILGEIVDGQVILNGFGRFTETALQWLPKQYPYVTLDTYVIMPNHLHAIICITDPGGSRTAPAKRKPLGRLVGAFKTVSTKWINVMRDRPGVPIWQRNYHDRVIRDDDELHRIRRYISENPSRWAAKMTAPFANGAL